LDVPVGVGRLNSDVVEEDVDPAEVGHGFLDHAAAGGCLAHVRRDEVPAAFQIGHPGDDVPPGVLVDVGDDDVRARAGKRAGGRAPHARCAAGDDGGLAGEVTHDLLC